MTNCPKLSLFFKETRNIYSYYLLQICSKMLALFLFFSVNTSLINFFSIISSFSYIINTNKEFFCHLHNLFVFHGVRVHTMCQMFICEGHYIVHSEFLIHTGCHDPWHQILVVHLVFSETKQKCRRQRSQQSSLLFMCVKVILNIFRLETEPVCFTEWN